MWLILEHQSFQSTKRCTLSELSREDEDSYRLSGNYQTPNTYQIVKHLEFKLKGKLFPQSPTRLYSSLLL